MEIAQKGYEIIMKTDKQLADEIEARKILEKMGYRKIKCKSCNGGNVLAYCFLCEGKGYRWEAPLTC